MIDKKKKCLICEAKEATKKNSHIVPSFLASMVASYDYSYKRDKELLFKIEPYKENIYIGALPDTKLDSVFNYSTLTEERIEKELSTNPVALDFIFCPQCETNLGTYLERPYADNLKTGKKQKPIEQLIFWISIIWRTSVTGILNFRLPKVLESELRLKINNFLELRKGESDLKAFAKTINHNYSIVYCPDYCKSKGGMICAEYNEEQNILAFTIGDLSLCYMFDKSEIPDDYTYFGFETHFRGAKNNNGDLVENRKIISTEEYKKSIDEYVNFYARVKEKEYVKIIDIIWTESGCLGYMPMQMKMKFLQMLYDENVKIGERKTKRRYLAIFNTLKADIFTWYLPI